MRATCGLRSRATSVVRRHFALKPKFEMPNEADIRHVTEARPVNAELSADEIKRQAPQGADMGDLNTDQIDLLIQRAEKRLATDAEVVSAEGVAADGALAVTGDSELMEQAAHDSALLRPNVRARDLTHIRELSLQDESLEEVEALNDLLEDALDAPINDKTNRVLAGLLAHALAAVNKAVVRTGGCLLDVRVLAESASRVLLHSVDQKRQLQSDVFRAILRCDATLAEVQDALQTPLFADDDDDELESSWSRMAALIGELNEARWQLPKPGSEEQENDANETKQEIFYVWRRIDEWMLHKKEAWTRRDPLSHTLFSTVETLHLVARAHVPPAAVLTSARKHVDAGAGNVTKTDASISARMMRLSLEDNDTETALFWHAVLRADGKAGTSPPLAKLLIRQCLQERRLLAAAQVMQQQLRQRADIDSAFAIEFLDMTQAPPTEDDDDLVDPEVRLARQKRRRMHMHPSLVSARIDCRIAVRDLQIAADTVMRAIRNGVFYDPVRQRFDARGVSPITMDFMLPMIAEALPDTQEMEVLLDDDEEKRDLVREFFARQRRRTEVETVHKVDILAPPYKLRREEYKEGEKKQGGFNLDLLRKSDRDFKLRDLGSHPWDRATHRSDQRRKRGQAPGGEAAYSAPSHDSEEVLPL
ncbi:MAG: hypothetical protein MHM6MM_004163 [Cercozoa sp. M6MM]